MESVYQPLARPPKLFKSCKVDAEDFIKKTMQLLLDAGFEPAEIIDAANACVLRLVKQTTKTTAATTVKPRNTP